MSALDRLSAADQAALRWAQARLEHPSLVARLSGALGAPLERAGLVLPRRWRRAVSAASEAAIERALAVAIRSLESTPPRGPPGRLHRTLGMTTGALGGFFGLPALLIELPVTTTIMLRAIADIARAEGEDLADLDARLACLKVFALGGRSRSDDAAEAGYYGIRLALARHLSGLRGPAGAAALGPGLPASVELVRAVAARFGVVVSQKAAAQLLPVLGAAGGATLNAVFLSHYEEMARGHFIVRRLERRYGPALVREAYRALRARPAA